MEKRKLNKRTSSTYFCDNVFDKFNSEEQIKSDNTIPKCLRDTYIYSNNKISETSENAKFDLVLFSNKLCGEIKLSDQFEIKKVIGKGSFGCVLEVYDNTIKKIAALKIIRNNSKISCSDLNLINLNHLNIPKFYRYFETMNNLFIVMELLEGGSLRDLIDQRYNNKSNNLFTEKEVVNIYQQMINGLRYLHDQDLIHRDIKPGNIKFIL